MFQFQSENIEKFGCNTFVLDVVLVAGERDPRATADKYAPAKSAKRQPTQQVSSRTPPCELQDINFP
jgi:hypothetical protein